MNDLILIALLLVAGGTALYFTLKDRGKCGGCDNCSGGSCPKCRKGK
ncbi:MAG: hypothetical protein MJ058_07910 [Akkermansia sp.]|nr:hypothetical protein [Akkermansia sp.]